MYIIPRLLHQHLLYPKYGNNLFLKTKMDKENVTEWSNSAIENDEIMPFVTTWIWRIYTQRNESKKSKKFLDAITQKSDIEKKKRKSDKWEQTLKL